MNTVTPKQMQMIWRLARGLGMDSDLLHARAEALSGRTSLKELTVSEAATLIDSLLGKPSESRYRASAGQIGIIRGLAKKLGWDDPQRLTGWLTSRWQVSCPEWLTSPQARECIEGMKAMLAGGRGERKKQGR